MYCVYRQSTDPWRVQRLRYPGSRCNNTMKARGVEVQIHSLTSALHDEWSASRSGRFTSGEINPFTHSNSRPHSRCKRLREENFCPFREPKHDSSVVQGVLYSQQRLGHRGSSLMPHVEIPLFSGNNTQSVNIPCGENAVFQC